MAAGARETAHGVGHHHLSDDEFGLFVLMLAVAGNETTRHAIAQAMLVSYRD